MALYLLRLGVAMLAACAKWGYSQICAFAGEVPRQGSGLQPSPVASRTDISTWRAVVTDLSNPTYFCLSPISTSTRSLPLTHARQWSLIGSSIALLHRSLVLSTLSISHNWYSTSCLTTSLSTPTHHLLPLLSQDKYCDGRLSLGDVPESCFNK